MTSLVNAEQAALWNGSSGKGWTDNQALLDAMFRPFQELLVEAAADAQSVLDVGCGTGSTTLAIARRLGAAGHATGLDISGPMLAAARARAASEGSRAEFIRADAQEHAFEPGRFDRVVSRFGVMFFGDPVRAFANLRRATRNDGALCAIAWRGPEDNPFMVAAERAAKPLLPDMPPRVPDAPGQFAFADSRRVRRILEEAGWASIDIRPLDVGCSLAVADFDRYLSRLGPLGKALQESDEPTRTRVLDVARAAYQPYVRDGEARFVAACWKVSATSG